MRSIESAIRELERAFAAFAPLFGRDLVQPVISVQSKERKNAYGWFSPDRWQNSGEDVLPEIVICSEHLSRTPEEIAGTLIHEMCHYVNHLEGIVDCSSFQYHNAHFKTRAESVGMVVEKTNRGYSRTTLGDALLARVREVNLDPEAFSLFRLTAGGGKKQPTKMKKWCCGCTNIRAATPVDAVCQACQKEFVAV